MSTRNQTKNKLQRKESCHQRVRAKVEGTAQKPRLSVSRSNAHICAQLIDDQKGITLAVSRDAWGSDAKKKPAAKAETGKGELGGKIALAFEVGLEIAKKAQESKIKEVVFDRGGYRYHGRVKSLADGARKGGLQF